ncbi:Hint domain-containing protein [Pseudorhodobacter aquimaris]|uniref:Hint domain-containing protein n=1 Tax=Pseudorhodobacter aquimaris TaxID=687412 RepID=UPI00067AF1EF|nr:Hint domain-containing protein [Pseudorhodobacter aquimaris]
MTYHTALFEPTSARLSEGIVAGTTVLTLSGEKRVEALKVGDRIITRSGARSLRAVRQIVYPAVNLVSISAAAFGVEQPQENILVLPDQGVLIRGQRAKALCGVAQAVIAARELTDGEFIRMETHFTASVFALEFDHPEVIIADGIELTCTPATVAA